MGTRMNWLRRLITWYSPAPVVRRPINVVDPELASRIEAARANLAGANNVVPLYGPAWQERQRKRAATELWGGPAA